MGFSISHQTEEQLELYALGRLPGPAIAVVEEHLLVCISCQERLDEVEAFALAMRDAIADEPATQARSGWFACFRSGLGQPGLNPRSMALAVGFAVLALASVLFLHTGRNVAPLASLQLTATRGETQTVKPAQKTEITLADAPAQAALRVEVVDATGGSVWNGPYQADAGKVKIAKQLPPGTYFVRLYDSTGKLLHEYGFRVSDTL